MKLLLDTHVLLWFIQGSAQLSDVARNLIEDPQNEKLVSVASLWEIAIKVSIDRLEIGMPITDLVSREIIGNALAILDIQPIHLDKLTTLPFHHKDPFDRLIIAQGLAEEISVVSRDRAFKAYSVQLLW